jgi:hypothetical protein
VVLAGLKTETTEVFMLCSNWLKCLSMALVLSGGMLSAIPAQAQACGGCVKPNLINRNPERREDRPNLPPETDSRDSSVRPPEMPLEDTSTRTSTMVINPQSDLVPDDRARTAPPSN